MSIIIKPIDAMITKDLDTFGKMDPYVVCILGQDRKQGAVCDGGGTSPSWSQTFIFQTRQHQLKIQLYDKDTFGSDDLIGQGMVNLKQLFMYPNKTQIQYVDLLGNGVTTGRIQMSMQYQGPAFGAGIQINQKYQFGNQQPNQWGNQQPNQWGNQQPNNQWGNQPNNQWGNQPNNQWGNQPNNQWGNQQQNQFGNQQGPPPGWGNNGGNNNGW